MANPRRSTRSRPQTQLLPSDLTGTQFEQYVGSNEALPMVPFALMPVERWRDVRAGAPCPMATLASALPVCTFMGTVDSPTATLIASRIDEMSDHSLHMALADGGSLARLNDMADVCILEVVKRCTTLYKRSVAELSSLASPAILSAMSLEDPAVQAAPSVLFKDRITLCCDTFDADNLDVAFGNQFNGFEYGHDAVFIFDANFSQSDKPVRMTNWRRAGFECSIFPPEPDPDAPDMSGVLADFGHVPFRQPGSIPSNKWWVAVVFSADLVDDESMSSILAQVCAGDGNILVPGELGEEIKAWVQRAPMEDAAVALSEPRIVRLGLFYAYTSVVVQLDDLFKHGWLGHASFQPRPFFRVVNFVEVERFFESRTGSLPGPYTRSAFDCYNSGVACLVINLLHFLALWAPVLDHDGRLLCRMREPPHGDGAAGWSEVMQIGPRQYDGGLPSDDDDVAGQLDLNLLVDEMWVHVREWFFTEGA